MLEIWIRNIFAIKKNYSGSWKTPFMTNQCERVANICKLSYLVQQYLGWRCLNERASYIHIKKNKKNTQKKYLHALPLLDRCQCNSKCWWKYFAKWRLSQNSLWADKAQMRVAARNGRGRKFAKTILKNEKGGEIAKTISKNEKRTKICQNNFKKNKKAEKLPKTISKKEKGRKIAKTISVFAIMWLFWGSHGVTWWCGSHFFIDKKVLI